MNKLIKNLAWALLAFTIYVFIDFVLDSSKSTSVPTANWGIAKDNPIR